MELGSKRFDIPTVCPLLVLLLTVAFKPLRPLDCPTLTLRHACHFLLYVCRVTSLAYPLLPEIPCLSMCAASNDFWR